MFRKTLVFGILLLFAGATIVPGIYGNVINQNNMIETYDTYIKNEHPEHISNNHKTNNAGSFLE